MPEWRNWQTRAAQNRLGKTVWVRFPPPAPHKDPDIASGSFLFVGEACHRRSRRGRVRRLRSCYTDWDSIYVDCCRKTNETVYVSEAIFA